MIWHRIAITSGWADEKALSDSFMQWILNKTPDEPKAALWLEWKNYQPGTNAIFYLQAREPGLTDFVSRFHGELCEEPARDKIYPAAGGRFS